MIYDSLATSDKEFISKVLCAINTRVNCWLNECASKPIRLNVDNEIICFNGMHCAIKTRQFIFPSLKPSKLISSKVPPKKAIIIQEMRINLTSPQKTGIIAANERMAKTTKKFSDKNSEKRPTINGVHVCPHQHIKGIYFTGCNLSSTHITITDPAICRKMGTYSTLFRSSNAVP